MTDQAPARALVEKSSSRNWPPFNEPPTNTLGTSLHAGAWVEHDERALSAADRGERRIWRNPDQTYGDMWNQPGRFGSILQWQAKRASKALPGWLRQLRQYALDLDACRTPLVLPWGARWREVGGTQAQAADNGCIVTVADGTSYEIQGMAPLSDWDVFQINLRVGAEVARRGDYRVDAITHRRPGVTPHGSQGPVWKADGLLRPQHLAGFVPGAELALVLPNVEKGPKARAVPPGWVELTTAQPFAGRTGGAQIADVGTGTVPNFCPFGVLIDDRGIEAWLTHLDTNYPSDGIPAAKRRNLIRNLRGYETDASKPPEPPTTLRCRENGTGVAIVESNGDLAGFAAQGVTPTNCGVLLRDLWLFATPIVTKGPA